MRFVETSGTSVSELAETAIVDAPDLQVPGNRTFYTLQAGRGIAAVMVVLFHIGSFGGAVPQWRWTIYQRVFYPGLYGVDFFFVLSGFVMVAAHLSDFDRPARVGRYFWNRVRRIYPIYWVVLVPTVLKQLLVTGNHGLEQRNPLTILSSFLLIHVFSLNVNLSVSWTLFHEVLFYAFFATLLLNKRLGIVLCAIWLAASLLFFVPDAYSAEPTRYLDMFFSPLHLLFVFGGIAGYVLQRRVGSNHIRNMLIGFAIYVLFIALHMRYSAQGPWLRIVAGAGLTLAIVSLAQREASSGFRVPRLLTFLGDASYSIYLSHFMIVWGLSRVCFRIDGRLHFPLFCYVAVILIVAISAGVIVHMFLERPLLRLVGAHKGTKSAVRSRGD